LLEARLVQGKGWVEYSIVPLYGPIAFIVEGEASYAPALAFPGPQLVDYERTNLYRLAGLDPGAAEHVHAVRQGLAELAGARLTIGQKLLDREIGEERALERLLTEPSLPADLESTMVRSQGNGE
jgi:hypothetical protein